jgi:hypothetical protein
MAKETVAVVVGKAELAAADKGKAKEGPATANTASQPQAQVQGQYPYYGRMICPYGHVGYGYLDTDYYKKWTCWNCGAVFWA